MKNKYNFALPILFLIVLACNCPKQESRTTDTKPVAEKTTAATTPAPDKPAATPAPEKTAAVNMENFKKLKNGMTYEQVVKILGKEGEEISSNDIGGTSTVMYKWDGDEGGFGANMNAMFQNNKLMSKSQFGLE